MNILIRAEDVIGEMSYKWYLIPGSNNWVTEMQSEDVPSLIEEIERSGLFKERVTARRYVIHFGKHDETCGIFINKELIDTCGKYGLEIEVF